MTRPEVSVVLAVRDGAAVLDATLASVLSQQGVALELICVDDGSTDSTAEVLAAHRARDPRVVPLRQEPLGLTAALILGCAAARGDFIARQDAGDRSLPGRLEAQVTLLRAEPGTAFVSCATRVVTEDGLPLFETIHDRRTRRGEVIEATDWPGPSHHGATMFRRESYERSGGYRRQFLVAQDFDLWLRLLEHGDHVGTGDTLYEATFAPGALSGSYRREQMRNARVALACARARRTGAPESPLLESCSRLPPRGRLFRARRLAGAHYFIGACLRSRPDVARHHFLKALRSWPLHLRSWWRLASTSSARTRPAETPDGRARGGRR